MRVLMLNTPFMDKFSRSSRSPAVAKGGTIYYPLWLAYATGVLEKAGHKVKLLDAPARGMDLAEVLKVAGRFKPEMVVLDTGTASIHSDVKVLEALKKKTGAFSVLVGTHASALPEETMKLNKEIDAIARKEYDYTLRELAGELEKKRPLLKKILGLSYRKKNKLLHNKDRPFIENLDELPFVSEVYKKHLKIEDYFYAANLYPEITIVTGRGCPYRCKFCVWPQVLNGRAYRARSVDNFLAEFRYIKENFPQAKEVFVEDDTFTANKYRIREFCTKMSKEGLNMTWSCNCRADVDLETLQAMKEAGCRLLCVGFESGEQKILNNISKGTNVERIKQFMKDTKKAGLLVHGCFMLGNQGETKETIEKTVKFAIELEPDTAQFFPIMVYPGTETYEWAKKNGFLTTTNFNEWLNSEGQHNCIVSRPGLSNKELVELCDKARKKFYLRPRYVGKKLKQAVTSPKEIPRTLKSSKTFFRYLLKK